jgi:hypothetical protein
MIGCPSAPTPTPHPTTPGSATSRSCLPVSTDWSCSTVTSATCRVYAAGVHRRSSTAGRGHGRKGGDLSERGPAREDAYRRRWAQRCQSPFHEEQVDRARTLAPNHLFGQAAVAPYRHGGTRRRCVVGGPAIDHHDARHDGRFAESDAAAHQRAARSSLKRRRPDVSRSWSRRTRPDVTAGGRRGFSRPVARVAAGSGVEAELDGHLVPEHQPLAPPAPTGASSEAASRTS